MTTIDITSELYRFELHLGHNPRTIFSAKFGDGKTYFLNEYIREHKHSARFIVLHPINYSVATNEDIFEYIKRDILVELAKYEEFKKVDWKAVAKEFFSVNTFLKVSQKAADGLKPDYIIKPTVNALLTAGSIFKKTRDKYAIESYFKHFSQMKGGIYEQDPFTVAIQAAVAKIKENGKGCVLIIEDLDRIDPGHLFRILNVLGAHIDEVNDTNKFGFDNIVAVLDYNTTEHVFHHFYGEDADYRGYMAKFCCHNIFKYSIRTEARRQLIELLQNECHLDSNDIRQYEWYQDDKFTIRETIWKRIEGLSVRDIVHILDDLQEQHKKMYIVPDVGSRVLLANNPVVKLLSVFVRMHFNFTTDNLTTFLCKSKEHFKMLGDFVCLQKNEYTHALLAFGSEELMIYVIEDEEGILKADYSGGSYNKRLEGSNLKNTITKLMPVVYGCVQDCKPLA